MVPPANPSVVPPSESIFESTVTATTNQQAPPVVGYEGSIAGGGGTLPAAFLGDGDLFNLLTDPHMGWLPSSWGLTTTVASNHQPTKHPSKHKRPRTMASPPGGGRRQTRAMAAAKAAAVASRTVIEVDDDDDDGSGGVAARGERRSPEMSPAASYLQTLGPMRMDFVSGDGGGSGELKFHSFNAMPTPHRGGTNMSKLRKEILEYMLNLPVAKQGSIFVRVGESRVDMVRALITGEYSAGSIGHRGCAH
jgi:hypothetical protein